MWNTEIENAEASVTTYRYKVLGPEADASELGSVGLGAEHLIAIRGHRRFRVLDLGVPHRARRGRVSLQGALPSALGSVGLGAEHLTPMRALRPPPLEPRG